MSMSSCSSMSDRYGSLTRRHWFDLGLGIGLILVTYLLAEHDRLKPLQLFAIAHLITLLCHQFEEYRWPGYFPGFVNRAMYKSASPDRFPLNTRSALVINVYFGWLGFVLGAIFYDQVWLNLALSLVSAGNVNAHVFIFNLKGKSLYNPGMATSVLLFLPIVVIYWHYVLSHGLATSTHLAVGGVLGVGLNGAVLYLIDVMKDRDTKYVFEGRQVRG
jgi:hypothetical protein